MPSGGTPAARGVHLLREWLRTARPRETQVLVALGLVVGVGAGLGAVIFRYLIEFFTEFFFDWLRPALSIYLGSPAVILIPALGGLLFGPLIYFFAREAKGHGVPEVMLAVALQGGRIRPVVAIVKSLASALCIGSGGSVGREGPIVQIGSAIGSTVGQVLRMSEERTRTLVACGAAGGIAATFNAPIAGVFFALEVILGQFTTRAFGVVVISGVTASVVGRLVFGNQPAFPVTNYELVSLGEYGLYAILGLLAGAVGVVFSRTLYWFEDRFDDVPLREYVKPIFGGLILGGIGFFFPQVFGVGYPAIGDALKGSYGTWLLVALAFLKILAVSITIGSGGSGGVFAPSLFVGAMFGTAFGGIARLFVPFTLGPAGAYGLVGMAAVFAGSARAPITAVIILFELTGDYLIILPLMVAVVLATLTSEALSRDTIYTLKLRRRGIDLRSGHDVDLMRTITVDQAMTNHVEVAPKSLSVVEAGQLLADRRERALVVVDEGGRLDGIVTLRDVERALLANAPGRTLGDVTSRPVVVAYADESLSEAISRMGARDLGQLPVVSRQNPQAVVGILLRGDIVRAYGNAMLNRMSAQQQRRVLPYELRGTRVFETVVTANSPMAGKRVADLGLPPSALVVAIERDGQVVIPRGDTQLLPSDRVTILAQQDSVETLHARLANQPSEKQ